MTCTVVTLLLSHLLTPCHIETGSDSIIRSEAGKYSTTAAHCSIRPSTRGTKLGVSNMCQTSKIFSRINFIIIFEGVTVFCYVCIIFLLSSCVRLCWWRRIVNDGGDMISAVSLSHEIMTRWLSARISPAPHHCTTHTNNHMINGNYLLPVKMLNNMYVILHPYFKQSAFWKSKVHCHNKYSFTLPAHILPQMIIYFMVCSVHGIKNLMGKLLEEWLSGVQHLITQSW